MAIVGKLQSLKEIFKKTQDLQELYQYLLDALTPGNKIHERILQTTGENKFDLGSNMIAIEQSYDLKNPENSFYESHRKYIDFQLMVKGCEYFQLGDINDFEIQSPYDEKKDLIIYEKSSKISQIRLDESNLAIFFDYDIHSGGLDIAKDPQRVFKTVVKVPKNLTKFRL